jgi:hypothetical protein
MLLLFVFSLSLIPTAVFAGSSTSNIPACCRKDGKHGCSMSGMRASEQHASHTSLKSVARCASFPKSVYLAPDGKAVAPPASGVSVETVLALVGLTEQAEIHRSVSFSRAWQKRGPPASLIS